MNTKTVLLPIKVPEGDYCWDLTKDYCICNYFNNEGGHPNCDLKFYDIKQNSNGVLKDIKCKELKDI